MSESSSSGRIRTPILSIVTIVALVASGIAIYVGVKHTAANSCRAVLQTESYTLAPEQAANATTIAAVGKRMGLPDHAVTVGLAAALQESNLLNLAHGDRDSLGLFQQRPSQGWGTAAQVMDPAYAAEAFFSHLAQVSGWETLPVTTAVQRVQHSASPDAYAQWEAEARVLAIATTGEAPAALGCRTPAASPGSIDPALTATMTAELGPVDLGTTMATPRGWTVASWLVAHARRFGIRSVSFDGRRWTRSATTWTSQSTAVRQVQIER